MDTTLPKDNWQIHSFYSFTVFNLVIVKLKQFGTLAFLDMDDVKKHQKKLLKI